MVRNTSDSLRQSSRVDAGRLSHREPLTEQPPEGLGGGKANWAMSTRAAGYHNADHSSDHTASPDKVVHRLMQLEESAAEAYRLVLRNCFVVADVEQPAVPAPAPGAAVSGDTAVTPTPSLRQYVTQLAASHEKAADRIRVLLREADTHEPEVGIWGCWAQAVSSVLGPHVAVEPSRSTLLALLHGEMETTRQYRGAVRTIKDDNVGRTLTHLTAAAQQRVHRLQALINH